MLLAKSFKSKQGARKKSHALGRGHGSGSGTTAGRGSKGQRARSGSRKGLKLFGSKALIQSLPKLRGFKSLSAKAVSVSLAQLQRVFADGTIITRDELVKTSILTTPKLRVKIVGNTPVEKKFTITGIPTSAGAKTAIEAAGGTVNN